MLRQQRLVPAMPDSKAQEIFFCLHGDLAEIEPEWKAFERHCACTALQSFDWITNCHRHLGAPKGAIPAIVFGRDRYGQLLFVLPFAIMRRAPFRCLTWLGSNRCPCNAALLAEGFSDFVSAERFARLWREIISRLRADRRFRFDWIDLRKMPESVGTQRNPVVGLEGAIALSDSEIDDSPNLGSKMFEYLAAVTIRGRLVAGVVAALRRARRFLRSTAVWRLFRKAGFMAMSIEWR
jgi:CelD/BcsL family acetyltransferase involved in cellulose biosynthesis